MKSTCVCLAVTNRVRRDRDRGGVTLPACIRLSLVPDCSFPRVRPVPFADARRIFCPCPAPDLSQRHGGTRKVLRPEGPEPRTFGALPGLGCTRSSPKRSFRNARATAFQYVLLREPFFDPGLRHLLRSFDRPCSRSASCWQHRCIYDFESALCRQPSANFEKTTILRATWRARVGRVECHATTRCR